MERLFGRSAAEIIGKTDLDLVGPAATERIREQDRRVLNGEVVKGVHTVRVQGVPIPFHYIKAPLHDEAGEIVGICGIARNISGLKQAEAALKESEERFRMLFDHVPDAYILADMQGEIIDCNQATAELAGYGREELVGNNFACLPWLDFRQQVRLADLLAQTATGKYGAGGLHPDPQGRGRSNRRRHEPAIIYPGTESGADHRPGYHGAEAG